MFDELKNRWECHHNSRMIYEVPPNRFSVKCLTELADERHRLSSECHKSILLWKRKSISCIVVYSVTDHLPQEKSIVDAINKSTFGQEIKKNIK